jgi:flagellar protein FliO/FliZ
MNLRHVIPVARKVVFAACATLSSVQAADAPMFAAPAPGHPAGATTGGSIGQVTIALAVVLAFVFVAAWALRHLRKLNLAGNAQQLQVLAQVTLGAKERAVLIRVNDMQVLVGVAPGQVTALHTFPAPPAAQASPGEAGVATNNSTADAAVTHVPSFQALLKKSLGMS